MDPNHPTQPLSAAALDQLFLEARTHTAWLDRPVEASLLRRIYELARMAPTAANCQPARIVFVTMAAPATAIVAGDAKFYEQMGKLFPARPEMGASLGGMPEAAREAMILQNTSLQAAYVIVAARSLGLDCGPMGGFDKAKVDAAFFADRSWRSSVLINLGYGDPARLHPRNPRLAFDEACTIE